MLICSMSMPRSGTFTSKSRWTPSFGSMRTESMFGLSSLLISPEKRWWGGRRNSITTSDTLSDRALPERR